MSSFLYWDVYPSEMASEMRRNVGQNLISSVENWLDRCLFFVVFLEGGSGSEEGRKKVKIFD